MRKLGIIILVFILASCAAPKDCCGQEKKVDLKKIFKFGTVYGAVNGGTSLSDQDVYSVTNGLQTNVIETPYDYSIILGIRKQKKFGYQEKERFKNGTENSFSDAATIGRWTNNIEFLFEGKYKRQEGEVYLDQHHMIRYIWDKDCEDCKFDWKHAIVKIEYLMDGFADIEYFESSERYRYVHNNKLSFNIGAAQRLSVPYGYDPLSEWLLSNGNLHYTELALQEGYTVQFDGQGGTEYFDPTGKSVATSAEVWEAVVIPTVLADYSEKKRDELERIIQHSWVLGFDYYDYSKKDWLHIWGSLMPLHYSDSENAFSYYNFNGGQWMDYSGGIVYGKWFNKNLGIFIEGKYNKYWNRTWHGFSAGINYRVF